MSPANTQAQKQSYVLSHPSIYLISYLGRGTIILVDLEMQDVQGETQWRFRVEVLAAVRSLEPDKWFFAMHACM